MAARRQAINRRSEPGQLAHRFESHSPQARLFAQSHRVEIQTPRITSSADEKGSIAAATTANAANGVAQAKAKLAPCSCWKTTALGRLSQQNECVSRHRRPGDLAGTEIIGDSDRGL